MDSHGSLMEHGVDNSLEARGSRSLYMVFVLDEEKLRRLENILTSTTASKAASETMQEELRRDSLMQRFLRGLNKLRWHRRSSTDGTNPVIVSYEVEFTDGSTLTFQSLERVLELRNSKVRGISEIALEVMAGTNGSTYRGRHAYVKLANPEFDPVYYAVT